jgi:hypothetical protein
MEASLVLDEGARLTLFPHFDSVEDVLEYHDKIVWYAAPCVDRIERLTFLLSPEVMALTDGGRALPPTVAPGMNPDIVGMRGRFAQKAAFVNIRDNGAAARAIAEADEMLVWNEPLARRMAAQAPTLSAVLQTKRNYNVDKHSVQEDSWRLITVFQRYMTAAATGRHEAWTRLRSMLDGLAASGRSRRCYLFGSGPSIADRSLWEVTDGHAVICNTMVGHRELIERAKPFALVFFDPVYPGCSEFSAAFMRATQAFLDRGDTWVVTVAPYEEYLGLVLPPALCERVIGLPVRWGEHEPEDVSLDLRAELHVTDTHNVMTALGVPLAATVADEIVFLGCDGDVDAGEPTYIRHDLRSLVRSFELCHARSAATDQDYTARHHENLAVLRRRMEGRGKVVRSLTPSLIPALAGRYAPERRLTGTG